MSGPTLGLVLAIAFLCGCIAGLGGSLVIDWHVRRKAAERHAAWMELRR
jgi:uncharacterized protein involved in exopolysaccharide biosynthesis